VRLSSVCCWLLLGNFAQSCAAQSAPANMPEANPARPTVSNPATLTPVGYLQFENGILYAKTSPEFSNQLGFNQVTKLAVYPRIGLILSSQPIAWSRPGSPDAVQEGDVIAGFQVVILPGRKSRPTISVGYLHRLHDGPAPDTDTGASRQSAILLVSDDLLGFHVDTNAILSEQPNGEIRRAQFGQTLSISHPLRGFTLAGEIWHFSQPFLRGNAVGNLWALSYSVRKNLVVDGGFNHGLTSTSTRWEVFVGFTYVLPHRLW